MLIGGGSVLVKSTLISVVGTDDVLSYDTKYNTFAHSFSIISHLCF